jgi:IclR family acetate operon transcriptional repressor
MASNKEEYTVRTTERSLDVIRVIQERGGVRLGEIVDEFGMAKSTAYKHLNTLVSRGYLVKDGDIYHIGLKFANRGEYARARKPGYRIAASKVDDLAERTDEEVDFMVENDGRGMTIHHSYDQTNPFQEKTVDQSNKHWRTGTYYHLHCLATGKAILSVLPRERVETIIEKWGLPERTENTITDRTKLFEELKRIREMGYVFNADKYVNGLAALAMPVMEPTGKPLGALAVNGPTYNLQGARQEELLDILGEVVTEFEDELADIEHPDPFMEGTML